MNLITKKDSVTRRDVEQLLNVSQTTANRILKHMAAQGLVYQDGNGRNTAYKKAD